MNFQLHPTAFTCNIPKPHHHQVRPQFTTKDMPPPRSNLLTNHLYLHLHPRLLTPHPLPLSIRLSSTFSSTTPTSPQTSFNNSTLTVSTPFNPPPTPIPATEEPFQKRKSGTKAGTVLRGLGYVRGKESILAKPDGEYPDWLWGILDNASSSSSKSGRDGEGADGEGDFFCELYLPRPGVLVKI